MGMRITLPCYRSSFSRADAPDDPQACRKLITSAGLSCATDFCPEQARGCTYAHLCDKTCGFCVVCALYYCCRYGCSLCVTIAPLSG
jgi:hypothetical protein|eukprot:SAG25_NODE_413_length_8292_cov_7.450629_6_plen_87_part_00